MCVCVAEAVSYADINYFSISKSDITHQSDKPKLQLIIFTISSPLSIA
jgi:hypothetical protein